MAYFRDFESRLPQAVAAGLLTSQNFAIVYANNKISDIANELLNDCPSPERLKYISLQVKNIKSLITKGDSKINQYKRLSRKLNGSIRIGKRLVSLLSKQPTLTAFGIPPGPAGGLITALPVGIIQKQSNLLVWVRHMVQTLEDDIVKIDSVVGVARTTFDPIKQRLTQLEALIAGCMENQDLTLEQRKEILDSIGSAPSKENTNYDESYVAANGRTYILQIIQDQQSLGGIAPKRRAIAKDFRGVTVIQGPLSFAGDPQILKNELKFRIDNQLP